MNGDITFSNISKTFQSAAGEFKALKNLNLSITSGEYVAIIGKSGSGKSTLLNMLSGIDHPSTGEVMVNKSCLNNMKETQLARFRGATIGIVFQFFQLIPTLTGLENLMLAMDLVNKIPAKQRKDQALRLLTQMDLTHHADKLPASLSGGEQQRIAIARALVNDPPILLADEPTGNLDSKTAATIHQIFGHCVAEGRTVIVVTHEKVSQDRYSRIITLADGEVIEDTSGLTSTTSRR